MRPLSFLLSKLSGNYPLPLLFLYVFLCFIQISTFPHVFFFCHERLHASWHVLFLPYCSVYQASKTYWNVHLLPVGYEVIHLLIFFAVWHPWHPAAVLKNLPTISPTFLADGNVDIIVCWKSVVTFSQLNSQNTIPQICIIFSGYKIREQRDP